MLRILTSSLLNIPMFNSIIITYFIPLADGKSRWSALQFYAWGSALDASWSLSASIIYFSLTSQTASAEKNIINTRQTFINSCDKMVQQHLPRKTVISGKGVSWFVCSNWTDWWLLLFFFFTAIKIRQDRWKKKKVAVNNLKSAFSMNH